MEQVSRVWFTPRQKAELWERWRSGQSGPACQMAALRQWQTLRCDGTP